MIFTNFSFRFALSTQVSSAVNNGANSSTMASDSSEHLCGKDFPIIVWEGLTISDNCFGKKRSCDECSARTRGCFGRTCNYCLGRTCGCFQRTNGFGRTCNDCYCNKSNCKRPRTLVPTTLATPASRLFSVTTSKVKKRQHLILAIRTNRNCLAFCKVCFCLLVDKNPQNI